MSPSAPTWPRLFSSVNSKNILKTTPSVPKLAVIQDMWIVFAKLVAGRTKASCWTELPLINCVALPSFPAGPSERRAKRATTRLASSPAAHEQQRAMQKSTRVGTRTVDP